MYLVYLVCNGFSCGLKKSPFRVICHNFENGFETLVALFIRIDYFELITRQH